MRFFRSLDSIHAMTFDLDDTLYDNEPIIQRANQELANYIQQNYPKAAKLTAEQWLNIKKQLLSKQPSLASDMGKLRWLTLFEGLKAESLSQQEHQQATDDCFDCFYHARSHFTLPENIHSLLKTLSTSLPLVAITNGNVNTQSLGIDGYFTHVLHASVERPMKPHPQMFCEASTLLGIPTKHILHVGDNFEKDIAGATRVGMPTAWFAHNRPMRLNEEPVTSLPSVYLTDLNDLLYFVS